MFFIYKLVIFLWRNNMAYHVHGRVLSYVVVRGGGNAFASTASFGLIIGYLATFNNLFCSNYNKNSHRLGQHHCEVCWSSLSSPAVSCCTHICHWVQISNLWRGIISANMNTKDWQGCAVGKEEGLKGHWSEIGGKLGKVRDGGTMERDEIISG